MLLVHIIFLAIFIGAALVIFIFSCTLDLTNSEGVVEDYQSVTLFLKLCMMNSLVNLVTSTFATYLLFAISENSKQKVLSPVATNTNQTISDLAWMRN